MGIKYADGNRGKRGERESANAVCCMCEEEKEVE